MSASNGVIRIGRKGMKKFAFGDDGPVFEVDVVATYIAWVGIDEEYRDEEGPDEGMVPTKRMPEYHEAMVQFVHGLMPEGSERPTRTEALEFQTKLREEYDRLADFFRPKKRGEEGSPGTSEVGLRFSVEPDPSPTSTS